MGDADALREAIGSPLPPADCANHRGQVPMPTHQIEQSDPQGSSSSTPTVEEVTRIVQEWVDLHARHLPDFAGAYLWGGITALPPEAPFPLYRDVDVVLVFSKGAD